MKDKAREPIGASIERWENEGGAPRSGDRSINQRPGGTNQRAKIAEDTGAPADALETFPQPRYSAMAARLANRAGPN